MMKRLEGPVAGSLLAVAVCLGVGGCAAKVNQDVYERDMAQIRGEIEGLDGRVGANEVDIAALSVRLDDLQAALEEIREEFDVAIARLEYGVRFVTPVHFDFDRADVRPADRPLLDRFADVVAHHYEGALITVEGFADPAGSAAYNRSLSERRARAVASYLQTEGRLPDGMFRTEGYGENRQVIPGARGPGDAGLENRRVAFVIEYAPDGGSSQLTASAEG